MTENTTTPATEEPDIGFIGELHPDEDFNCPTCNKRSVFRPDEVLQDICHIRAGSAVNFTGEELRDWLRAGAAPDAEHDAAVSDTLMELGTESLHRLATTCGASIREIARFVRRTEPRHWTTVWFLNSQTQRGSAELPFWLDKEIGAGNAEWWD